jgi:hypothetical protein
MDRDVFGRQGELIAEKVKQYRLGAISLNRLAQDLDALWTVASAFTPTWSADFRDTWAVLEEVNAVQLDEGNQSLTDSDKALIADALTKIDTLARELVQT